MTASKLFVGNLPYSTDDLDLKDMFYDFGFPCTETKVIRDRETGQSRGFGFVTLENQADIAAAIDQINGRDFGGRQLTVNEAKEKDDRGHTGGRPGGDRGRPSGGRPSGGRDRNERDGGGGRDDRRQGRGNRR